MQTGEIGFEIRTSRRKLQIEMNDVHFDGLFVCEFD